MKRVIIFCNRGADHPELHSLFNWEACLDVIGWEVEPDEAIRRVQQIQPELIIIAHDEAQPDLSVEVERLLQSTQGIPVVEMGLHDRKVCIHRSEESMLHQIQELLESIA